MLQAPTVSKEQSNAQTEVLIGTTVGTRFMCVKEAQIHDKVKETMVASDERNTVSIDAPLHTLLTLSPADTHLPHAA